MHRGATLDDGRKVTRALYQTIRDDEVAKLPNDPHVGEAAKLLDGLVIPEEFLEFLTLPAYRLLE